MASNTPKKPLQLPIAKIIIGEWKRLSVCAGSLAKCYFGRTKLSWEIREEDGNGLKKRIEIQWNDVLSIRENPLSLDGLVTLDVELSKPPKLFLEDNLQAGGYTRWKETHEDFTSNQASICRRHRLHFSRGVLPDNLEKLASGDSFWAERIKIPFPTLPDLYFEQYQNHVNNMIPHQQDNEQRRWGGEFLGLHIDNRFWEFLEAQEGEEV